MIFRTIITPWKDKRTQGDTGANGHKKYRVKKFSFQAIITKYLMELPLYNYING